MARSKKKLVALLCLALWLNGRALPAAGGDQIKKDTPPPVGRFIPGFYQLGQKKTLKGLLLLAGFTVGITGAIAENRRGNRLYEQYLNSQNPQEVVELRRLTEERFRRRNYYIAAACGVWLLHLLDVTLIGKKKSKKGGISGEISKDRALVGFYYTF